MKYCPINEEERRIAQRMIDDYDYDPSLQPVWMQGYSTADR